MPRTNSEDNSKVSQCDREAIHLIGTIQPHGALLVANADLVITHVSANIEGFLACPAKDLLGTPLAPFLTKETKSVATGATADDLGEYHYSLLWNESDFHASLYRSGLHWILELEPMDQETVQDPLRSQSLVRHWKHLLEGCDDWRTATQIAATELRKLTGYDRVMVYRFAEDNHGWVASESKRDDWESYLDLHYPATDIPEPARRLLLLHPIRQIVDINAREIQVTGRDGDDSGKAVDLTRSALRQPSSIHLEYLGNMGVSASLTASVIINNRLWGLIACHHGHPFHQSRQNQADILAMAQLLASRLEILANRAALQHHAERSILAEGINRSPPSPQAPLQERSQDFLHLVEPHVKAALNLTGADGLALQLKHGLHLFGHTPDRKTTQALLEALPSLDDAPTFSSERLKEHFPSIPFRDQDPAGVIVHRPSTSRKRAVLWFRRETIETINWAGDPTKTVEVIKDGNQPISPRKSFEAWKQTTAGSSSPWSSIQIESARAIGSTIMARWDHLLRLRAEESLVLKIEEMNQLNNDLQNLSEASEVATLFLDQELRILRFTPHVTHLFQVSSDDIGRPLTDLKDNLGYRDLANDVATVLSTRQPVEKEIQSPDGIWHLVRVLPYRGGDEETNSTVVTFVDVHALKTAERRLEAAATDLEQRVKERTRQVRELSARLTLAEQKERDRIAQILHDDIQQMLVAMQMRVQMLLKGQKLTAMEDLHKGLEKTMAMSRELTTDLSPPVLRNEGFLETLYWLRDLMADRYQLAINVQAPDGCPNLPMEIRVILFQIVRELLFNVVKHAKTGNADLILRPENGLLELEVRDYGQGIQKSEPKEKPKSGFGTAHIQEQLDLLDGSFELLSHPREGCRAIIRLPTAEPVPD